LNLGSLALTPRHWLRTGIRLRRTGKERCPAASLAFPYLRAIADTQVQILPRLR